MSNKYISKRTMKHRPGYTDAQWEVLELLLKGLAHKDVCSLLDLQAKALKHRLMYIYVKTDTHSAVQLLGKALQLGVNPRSRESVEQLLLPEYRETNKTQLLVGKDGLW